MTFEEAQEAFRRAARKAQPATVEQLREQTRKARADVLAGWPRDTGESARGFKARDTRDGAELVNDVRYTFFVGDGQAHRDIGRSLKRQEAGTVAKIERAISKELERS